MLSNTYRHFQILSDIVIRQAGLLSKFKALNVGLLELIISFNVAQPAVPKVQTVKC